MNFLIATMIMSYPFHAEAHPTTDSGENITTIESLAEERAQKEAKEYENLVVFEDEVVIYIAEDVEEKSIEEEFTEIEEDYIEQNYVEDYTEEHIELNVDNNEVEEEAISLSSDDSVSYIGLFQATNYAVGDGLTPNTYTRNGTDVSNTIYSPEGYRIIAVDTNVIPLNSIVRVHVPGWEPFTAIAADTGGAIVGNIIDILTTSPSEASSFGRRDGIEVYMIQ